MKRYTLLAFCAGICCFRGAAAAGNAENPGVADALEEVMVTAQKREERLQDVPIAITAVTAGQLKDFKIDDSFGLTKLTPGMTMTRAGGGFGVAFIRGVGSTNQGVGDEPSVATYIDGFYRGPNVSSILPFNNIDHVEILKGPQGTLYGRNATGGLINIITRAPQDHFYAQASGGIGRFDTYEATGYVTGPLTEALRADLAVDYRDQSRGVAHNLTTGHLVGEDDTISVRSKLVAQLAANTSLTFGADYSRTSSTVGASQSIYPGTVPITALVGGTYSTTPYEITNNADPKFTINAVGFTAKLAAELHGLELVSMSQFRNYRAQLDLDLDGSSLDGVRFVKHPTLGGFFLPTVTLYTTYKLPRFLTQEFQLQSKSAGPLSWIVGAFGLNSEEAHDPLILAAAAAGPPTVTIEAKNETTAGAGFAQSTYAFENGLSVTTGARYSWERRRTDGSQTAGTAITTTDKSKSFSAFTYRLSLDYRANDALLLYTSASKGFKSGAYVVANIDKAPPVNPEKLYAYEVGFKADPSHKLRVDGSIYYYDYKDMQLFVTSPAGLGSLENAASSKLYGAELEIETRPLSQLTLRAAVSWEHTRYGHFADAQVYVETPPAGERQLSVDVTGNQLIRAPKYTANVGINYDIPLPKDNQLSLAGNLYYNDGFPFDPAAKQSQKSYYLADATLTWRFPGDNWSVTAWGRNLSDQRYIDVMTPGPRNVRVGYALPRTFGLTVSFKTH